MENKGSIRNWIRLLRIRQYGKNLFIFAPVLFDGQLFIRSAFLKTLWGFVGLCLLSSAVYIFNDIIDREADRRHPRKCSRPIASGAISVRQSAAVAAFFALAVLVISGIFNKSVFLLFLAMLVINIAYSLRLKHIPLIDVITIGVLFLMRVAAGALIVRVKMFSPWLYIVTFMLSLFLGFGKRRAELALLKDGSADSRPVLDGYSLPLLDQLITIVSSVTIMAYSLYTFSGPTLPENNRMMLTIPFVVFGIFRYHYLIQMKHEGGAPEEVLFTDKQLIVVIVLYAAVAVWALYF